MFFSDGQGPLILLGTATLSIANLSDGVWQPDENLEQTIYEGAIWQFYPDGSFRFTPSRMVSVRDDMYPFVGTYTLTNNLIELQGQRRGEYDVSLSLDGFVQLEPGLAQASLIKISGPLHIVSITQEMEIHHVVPPPLITEIHGIAIPSIFRITLSGTVDERPFAAFTGTLKFLPSRTGDSNPFYVELRCNALAKLGNICWYSSHQFDGRCEMRGTLTAVAEGRMRLEVDGEPHPLSPSWSSPQLLARKIEHLLPVYGTQGMLTFSVQGDQIAGTIRCVGKPALAESVSYYEATFVGYRQRTEGSNG